LFANAYISHFPLYRILSISISLVFMRQCPMQTDK